MSKHQKPDYSQLPDTWSDVMKKPLLEKGLDPAQKQLILVLNELADESRSDRSTAILGAAWVDENLTNAIKARLQQGKPTDELFEGWGPMGPFSARLRFAYAIGIVGPKYAKDLQLINDIRNRFAHDTLLPDQHHTLTTLSFDSPKISGLCKKLWIPTSLGPEIERAEVSKSHRKMYLHAAQMLAHGLWFQAVIDRAQHTIKPSKWLID